MNQRRVGKIILSEILKERDRMAWTRDIGLWLSVMGLCVCVCVYVCVCVCVVSNTARNYRLAELPPNPAPGTLSVSVPVHSCVNHCSSLQYTQLAVHKLTVRKSELAVNAVLPAGCGER
jgi:hypothetical protein